MEQLEQAGRNGRMPWVVALPKLKLKVEYAILGYLLDELTDAEFKAKIQAI